MYTEHSAFSIIFAYIVCLSERILEAKGDKSLVLKDNYGQFTGEDRKLLH